MRSCKVLSIMKEVYSGAWYVRERGRFGECK